MCIKESLDKYTPNCLLILLGSCINGILSFSLPAPTFDKPFIILGRKKPGVLRWTSVGKNRMEHLPAVTDALPQPEVTWHDRLLSPDVTFLLDNMAARKEAHMTYVPLKSIPAA